MPVRKPVETLWLLCSVSRRILSKRAHPLTRPLFLRRLSSQELTGKRFLRSTTCSPTVATLDPELAASKIHRKSFQCGRTNLTDGSTQPVLTSPDGVPTAQQVGAEVPGLEWSLRPQPVLEAVIRQYGHAKCRNAMLLHGPRGVGKRTAVEVVVRDWRKPPQAVAYVDLETLPGEGEKVPWMHMLPASHLKSGRCDQPTSRGGTSGTQEESSHGQRSSLADVRCRIEGGLERLAVLGVRGGHLSGGQVFDALNYEHSVDGALQMFLASRGIAHPAGAMGEPHATVRLWLTALQAWKDMGGSQILPLGLDDCSAVQDDVTSINGGEVTADLQGHPAAEGKHNAAENLYLPTVGRASTARFSPGSREVQRAGSLSKAYFKLRLAKEWEDELSTGGVDRALDSLSLAKEVLAIQERQRCGSRGGSSDKGVVGKGQADAAAAWSSLLLDLLSAAFRESAFEPRLVLIGLQELRRSSAAGGVDGSAFHDSWLLRLISRGCNEGCMPVVLVSSDSYYSRQVYDDFGSTFAFRSHEVFGWTPAEAAVYLVPQVFDPVQWTIVKGVLGSNKRQLAEFYPRWAHVLPTVEPCERIQSLEDCLDEHLAHLQVTVVDPAIDAALRLVEAFAEKAAAGALSPDALNWGTAWRQPPKGHVRRRRWARLQMCDFIRALGRAHFVVEHRGPGSEELLEDPACEALVEVGLLYVQDWPFYVRPTTVAFQRCIARWLVQQQLQWTLAERLQFYLFGVMRGRYYRHLMR